MFNRGSLNRFPLERPKAGRRVRVRITGRLHVKREIRAMRLLSVFDKDGPVDQRGALPIGAFPLLESLWPAGSRDKEKARLIVSLLQLGLRQDSDL